MSHQNSGLFVHGTVKGIKETPYTDDDGNKKISYKLGLAVQVDDGYGGINTNIFEVKISPNLIDEVAPQLSSVRDKFCLVPVIFNDGRFKSISLRSGSKIQTMKEPS